MVLETPCDVQEVNDLWGSLGSSCSFLVSRSAWRQVGCFLLHLEHTSLLQHLLETWPFFRHPKHKLFSLTNYNLLSVLCSRNFMHTSSWWPFLVQKVQVTCCLEVFLESGLAWVPWLERKMVLFSLVSFCRWCLWIPCNASASFTVLQEDIGLQPKLASSLTKDTNVLKLG